ncbi:hypothetical protein EYF80_047103 [Liparis tanakae]|uniref:Uncharacterized protein n=1 Tax=Liparis tanakae TaxID=230148 RepID=A0A4Z2FPB8_9TELE|nr:hypothetical protein EYF80_047103 [Liparis tanakae]
MEAVCLPVNVFNADRPRLERRGPSVLVLVALRFARLLVRRLQLQLLLLTAARTRHPSAAAAEQTCGRGGGRGGGGASVRFAEGQLSFDRVDE